MKSHEFIDLAKKKQNITSYKLSLNTGISQSALTQYKKENRIMDDYACFKIAEILCIDPRKIIARANEEREKDEEKKEFWQGKVKEYGYADSYLLSIISIFMMILVTSFVLLKDIMSTLISVGYETYIDVLINFSVISEALFLFTSVYIMRSTDEGNLSENCILA